MKKIYYTLYGILIFSGSFAQTPVTVDANDIINSNNKLVIQTSVGQSFFTGHQLGVNYGYSTGIFRAMSDNVNNPLLNYFYDGLTGGTVNFSVRSDGQGYFANSIGIGVSNSPNPLSVRGSTPWGAVKIFPSGDNLESSLAFSLRASETDLSHLWLIGVGSWGLGENFTIGNSTHGGPSMLFMPNGNVGIGTTNPVAKLHIAKNNVYNDDATATSVDNLVTLQVPYQASPNTISGAGYKWGMKFLGTNEDNTAITKSAAVYAVSEDPDRGYNRAIGLAFHTSMQDQPNHEVMRISNDGKVGVGTSMPLDKLDIAGTSGGYPGRVVFGDGNAYAPYMKFIKWSGYANSYLQTTIGNSLDVAGGLSFQTGSGGGIIGSDVQTTRMVITQPGSVGIGLNTPAEKLTVNGNIRAVFDNNSLPDKNVAGIVGLGISGATGANNWSLRGVYQYDNGVNLNSNGGDLDLIKSLDGNTVLGTKADGTPLGNVSIGTTDSKGYKFAVAGRAIAESMTVKLQNNWPDYVFKNDYKLPTLSELQSYIQINHRLPEMPSEKEVSANGLNLGEINKLLTKKVEELTLYLIEKDVKEKAQDERIKKLEAQMEQLLATKKP